MAVRHLTITFFGHYYHYSAHVAMEISETAGHRLGTLERDAYYLSLNEQFMDMPYSAFHLDLNPKKKMEINMLKCLPSYKSQRQTCSAIS